MPVAKGVDLATAVDVMEHRDLYPEISVTRTAERRYPQGFQAADLLGYVGQINKEELDAHPEDDYQTTDTIGKTGIEQMFESELRGTPGRDKVEVDNEGRAVDVVDVKPPEAGHDVRLTVDLPTQHIAEESLTQGMDGAPHARRPRQRELLLRQRRRGGGARRAAPARWWRWRRTRVSTPTTSSAATPTSTSTTRTSR